MPLSPSTVQEMDEEEQTPWLALTIFSRTLEFTDSELKDIRNQLRNGNIFIISKTPKSYKTRTYTFKIRTRRRSTDKYNEHWLTNDTRREFLKDYDSGAYKTKS
jgi:hypothetical protein